MGEGEHEKENMTWEIEGERAMLEERQKNFVGGDRFRV